MATAASFAWPGGTAATTAAGESAAGTARSVKRSRFVRGDGGVGSIMRALDIGSSAASGQEEGGDDEFAVVVPAGTPAAPGLPHERRHKRTRKPFSAPPAADPAAAAAAAAAATTPPPAAAQAPRFRAACKRERDPAPPGGTGSSVEVVDVVFRGIDLNALGGAAGGGDGSAVGGGSSKRFRSWRVGGGGPGSAAGGAALVSGVAEQCSGLDIYSSSNSSSSGGGAAKENIRFEAAAVKELLGKLHQRAGPLPGLQSPLPAAAAAAAAASRPPGWSLAADPARQLAVQQPPFLLTLLRRLGGRASTSTAAAAAAAAATAATAAAAAPSQRVRVWLADAQGTVWAVRGRQQQQQQHTETCRQAGQQQWATGTPLMGSSGGGGGEGDASMGDAEPTCRALVRRAAPALAPRETAVDRVYYAADGVDGALGSGLWIVEEEIDPDVLRGIGGGAVVSSSSSLAAAAAGAAAAAAAGPVDLDEGDGAAGTLMTDDR